MHCFILIEISNNFMNIASLKYLKEKNIRVILFCKNILFYNNEIIRLCDEVLEINTHQISSLISACNFIAKKQKILGVMTLDDHYLIQTAQLKEYLGFYTTTSENIENMIDRYKMRCHLKKINSNLNPKSYFANSLNESILIASEMSYPFIIRPITKNKFIQSKKVNNLQELKDFFQSEYSKVVYQSWEHFSPGVLLEEEIKGDEFSVHFLKVSDGRIILAGVFKKENILLEDRSFINITTQFPADYAETDYLFAKLSPILPKIGFNLGLLQIDCKICNGSVKILNINPTINNNVINYFLMQKSIGIDFSKINIDLQLTSKIEWFPSSLKEVVVYKIIKNINETFLQENWTEKMNDKIGLEVIKLLPEDLTDGSYGHSAIEDLLIVANSHALSLELISNFTKHLGTLRNVG